MIMIYFQRKFSVTGRKKIKNLSNIDFNPDSKPMLFDVKEKRHFHVKITSNNVSLLPELI